jgi:hypothetical protein
MSRMWCFYLRSENRASKSGHDFDGWFWKDLDSSMVQTAESMGRSLKSSDMVRIWAMAEAKDGRKREFGRLALVYNAAKVCARVRAESGRGTGMAGGGT